MTLLPPSQPRGGEVLAWLLQCAQRLEYEGICANGELLLEDVLQLREVSYSSYKGLFPALILSVGSQGYTLE